MNLTPRTNLFLQIEKHVKFKIKEDCQPD